jgi:alkylation response protein AidB-like acyl-CoA dehydrogenase
VTDAAAIIERAEDIAERVLFHHAIETDAADLVPLRNLDAIADAGLYGITALPAYGGLGGDVAVLCGVIEALAGGCLTTAFVWVQHQTPLRTISGSPNEALKNAWLPRMCLVNGRTEGDRQVVSALVPAEESETLSVQPLRLTACNGSGTVGMRLQGHFVPEEMVVAVDAYKPPPARDGGGRPNGSLSLGVARRCCSLIGPSPLDDELDLCRRLLGEAGESGMADARAAASHLAFRAAAALVVAKGSTSLFPTSHAQRLLREAAFLQVFGSRPAIRAGLLMRFSAGGARM